MGSLIHRAFNFKYATHVTGLLVAIAFFAITLPVHAANLYLYPANGSFAVGQTISVDIYVSSTDNVMNAASGVVLFPSDKLQVVSVSKTGSIMNLWVQEPVFSNSAGTFSFEGIALNPGFTGSAGKIITVNFKVVGTGIGNLSVTQGSVLANDGLGTGILSGVAGATFSFGGVVPGLPNEVGIPGVPTVTSNTHPDSSKWYSKDTATFEWQLPQGVTGTRLLIGRIVDAVPLVTYVPPVSTKTIEDLDEGISYFHVRLRNDDGWGGIAHFRLNVDTVNPSSLSVNVQKRDDETDPVVVLNIKAQDETSGIDHYEVSVDGGESLVVPGSASQWASPALGPGNHKLAVRVFDKAGNNIGDEVSVDIKGLDVPKITSYPNVLVSGETLVVKGETYSNVTVKIFVAKEGEDPVEYTTLSDNQGKFAFSIDEKLNKGAYELWAQVEDRRGAQSDLSDKKQFTVRGTNALFTGDQAMGTMLFLVLLIIAWYVRSTFVILHKKISKEISEAEVAVRKAFDLLKVEIEDQVGRLHNIKKHRDLTKEEEKMLRRFKKNLKDAEKFIEKEIQDIADVL